MLHCLRCCLSDTHCWLYAVAVRCARCSWAIITTAAHRSQALSNLHAVSCTRRHGGVVLRGAAAAAAQVRSPGGVPGGGGGGRGRGAGGGSLETGRCYFHHVPRDCCIVRCTAIPSGLPGGGSRGRGRGSGGVESYYCSVERRLLLAMELQHAGKRTEALGPTRNDGSPRQSTPSACNQNQTSLRFATRRSAGG